MSPFRGGDQPSECRCTSLSPSRATTFVGGGEWAGLRRRPALPRPAHIDARHRSAGRDSLHGPPRAAVRRSIGRDIAVRLGDDDDALSDDERFRESSDAVDDDDDVVDTDSLESKRRVGLLEAEGNTLPTMQKKSVSVEINGRTVHFETGLVARQASGAVVIRTGESMMLCTACVERKVAPSADFLPLRVDFAEKFSAVGKTVSTYFKREGKPSEREVLMSRLIDRPLRPMFEDGFLNEVQVLANVYSYDNLVPIDVLAICGAAAALHISEAPLRKAVAAVRVGMIDDAFVVNPSREELERSQMDMVVAGTPDAILMIEGECAFLTEAQVLEAIALAQSAIARICAALDELRELAGKPKITSALRIVSDELLATVQGLCGGIEEAVKVFGKKDRENAINEIKDRIFSQCSPSAEQLAIDPEAQERLILLQMAWKKVISRSMRRLILEENFRPDGRGTTTVRPISILPRFLPSAHGSVLFTRGETQTLTVATLGGEEMAQKQETVEGDNLSRFYLQYNFPPFSVGEVGRLGAPGRREIGHGKLAERSLQLIVPDKDEFPYVIRVESNILESNGSSSMASVCGGCLALMDAGVPIKRRVAGVAMGLIIERDEVAILTDILGMEDALGDMDFKIAGDELGISAVQMDIKVEGITASIMKQALERAREGKLHILKVMQEAMPSPRHTLPSSVPKVRVTSIPVKKIGDVIGPGGKQIKAIIEECGGESNMNINISQEGQVTIMSSNDEMIEKAVNTIGNIAVDIQVGQRYTGKVTKTLPFGAYVEILPGKEAWCHISELEYKRTEKVEDVCKEGDEMEVEVTEVARGGQYRVSRKKVLPPPPPLSSKSSAAGQESGQDSNKKGNGMDSASSSPRSVSPVSSASSSPETRMRPRPPRKSPPVSKPPPKSPLE